MASTYSEPPARYYKDPTFHCIECGRETRRSRVRLEQAPGTATYGGRGMCNPCYERTPKDKHPTVSEGMDARTEHNRRAVQNYLKSRRPHREALERQMRAQLRRTA